MLSALIRVSSSNAGRFHQIRAMSCAANLINKERLRGKVAIVTASTDGIGFGIAERLASEGASVLISSRTQNNVDNAVKSLKDQGFDVEGIVCHVAKEDERKRLFDVVVQKFGGLDILVSNAAVNPNGGPVLDTPESKWDKIFDVNVKCSYLLAKESLPLLRQRKGGSIVFVASVAGLQPIQNIGAYSVSKTALISLTKTASVDLAPENIRVNCIAPGLVPTKFVSMLIDTEESKKMFLDLIPMGRFGRPEEIASATAFLVSEDASYITGETLVVAGGAKSRL